MISDEKVEMNRVIFGKTLAKALGHIGVRKLIKEEAQKRFNKDTEVLYHLVKDKTIDQDVSLASYLASVYGDQEAFNEIANSLPLLTFLVPHLSRFDAEKWDVESEIPIVSIYPSKPYRKSNNITASETFNRFGVKGSIKFKSFPDEPLVVVKDNERTYVEKGTVTKRTNENSVFQFKFVDEYFNNLNGSKVIYKDKKPSPRLDIYNRFDSRVRFAYENNLPYHRDYVYYNIAPSLGLNTGTLNTNYSEFLTSFELQNSGVFGELHDDNITDSPYSDGDLEFIIKVFAVSGNNTIELVSKWFDVPYSGLVSIVPIGNGYWKEGVVRHYVLPTPLELAVWDMKQYGNTLKFALWEEDATTSQTLNYSVSLSSTFGFNFSNNIKDGPNFGSNSSSTQTIGGSYTLQVNGGNDPLYEALVYWHDPVLFWDEPAMGPGAPAPWNQHWARSKEYSTGKVKFSIEPRLR